MSSDANVQTFQDQATPKQYAITIGWVLGRTALGLAILAVTMGGAAWLTHQGIDQDLEANRLKMQRAPIAIGAVDAHVSIGNAANGGATAAASVAAPAAAAAAAAVLVHDRTK